MTALIILHTERPLISPPLKVPVGNPIPVDMFSEYVQQKHVNENWAFCDDYKVWWYGDGGMGLCRYGPMEVPVYRVMGLRR